MAAVYTPISAAKKETATFYGMANDTSYLYDTYETHVSSVSVDAGVEIGPKLHHPHFHLLLKIEHYTYVQIDKFRMKAVLEQLFREVGVVLGAVELLALAPDDYPGDDHDEEDRDHDPGYVPVRQLVAIVAIFR